MLFLTKKNTRITAKHILFLSSPDFAKPCLFVLIYTWSLQKDYIYALKKIRLVTPAQALGPSHRDLKAIIDRAIIANLTIKNAATK